MCRLPDRSASHGQVCELVISIIHNSNVVSHNPIGLWDYVIDIGAMSMDYVYIVIDTSNISLSTFIKMINHHSILNN